MKILLPLSLAALLLPAAGCQPAGVMAGGSGPQTSAKRLTPKKLIPKQYWWLIGKWVFRDLIDSRSGLYQRMPPASKAKKPGLSFTLEGDVELTSDGGVKYTGPGVVEFASKGGAKYAEPNNKTENGSFQVEKDQLTINLDGVVYFWDIHQDSDRSFYLTEPGNNWPIVSASRPIEKHGSNIDDTGAGPHLITALKPERDGMQPNPICGTLADTTWAA
jgi:hypothetical protein